MPATSLPVSRVEVEGMRRLAWSLALGVAVACGFATEEPGSTSEAPLLPNRRVFPADNPWNRSIAADPVDPKSDSLIARCGGSASVHPDFGTTYGGAPWGIPFTTVSGAAAARAGDLRLRGRERSGALSDSAQRGRSKVARARAATGTSWWWTWTTGCCTSCSTRTRSTAVRRGRRDQGRSSTWPPTRCGTTAGPPPTRRGCRSSPVWCATTRS